MVECKYIRRFNTILFFDVLIDTWWNVNKSWNEITFDTIQGFNRYMVECKSIQMDRNVI